MGGAVAALGVPARSPCTTRLAPRRRGREMNPALRAACCRCAPGPATCPAGRGPRSSRCRVAIYAPASSSTVTKPSTPGTRRLTMTRRSILGRERTQHVVVDAARCDEQPIDAVLVHEPLEAELGRRDPRPVELPDDDDHVAALRGPPFGALDDRRVERVHEVGQDEPDRPRLREPQAARLQVRAVVEARAPPPPLERESPRHRNAGSSFTTRDTCSISTPAIRATSRSVGEPGSRGASPFVPSARPPS